MKEKIIRFFREDRSYKGAMALYYEVGNSIAIKKQLNLQSEAVMKNVLFDQLRILAGITPDQYKLMMAAPLPKAEPVKTEPEFKHLDVEVPKPPAATKKKKSPKKKAAPKK